MNFMRVTGGSSKTEENWHFALCYSKTSSIASQGIGREGITLKTPHTRTYSVFSFPLQKEIYLILSTFFSSCS